LILYFQCHGLACPGHLDAEATANDPMKANFIGFQLWVQAVSAAGTTEPAAVRSALAGRSIRAPYGSATDCWRRSRGAAG